MTAAIFARGERSSPLAFWFGVAAVTAGVSMHLPMFAMARSMGYRLAGMEMDPLMIAGMGLIVLGTGAAAYGLVPRKNARDTAIVDDGDFFGQGDDRLTLAHWQLMLTLTLALVIDAMKPASLGFVVPGMAAEYNLTRPEAALLPLFALTGTTIGSFLWGFLADLLGRRAAILLAAIMFIGTSICGAMPSFGWNLAMCFLMGVSAGGMLPIAYTLLAELVPAPCRCWFLVLLGGLGLAAGYLAAAACAAWLEPQFSWRIMWFLGFPTGLLLILLNRFIPELPRYLILRGRISEARAVMRRFGTRLPAHEWGCGEAVAEAEIPAGTSFLFKPPYGLVSLSLMMTGLAWSLVNFGLILWLPAELRAHGFDIAASNALLAQSALFSLPTVLVSAWLYARWSTKKTLVLLASLTILALLGLALLGHGVPLLGNNVLPLIAILMVGTNGMIAVLLPYAAESFPVQLRGRGTGFVAGSSKVGGLAGQALNFVFLASGLTGAALIVALPVACAAALIARYGAETRMRVLDELDCNPPAQANLGGAESI